MSQKLLPKTIEPRRLAEQGQQLLGEISLDNMLRLSSLIVSAPQAASVHMQGGIDTEGWHFLKGKINVRIQLQCQRCMQPYHEQLNAEFCLVPISHEHEAKRLPDHYEGLCVENHIIDMATLIEDELILALPFVPRHSINECPVQLLREHPHEVEKKPNPFADLAKLKNE